MKIIAASFTYPPNKDGVSNAADTMVRIFRNDGHQVLVATSPLNPKQQTPPIETSVNRFNIVGEPAIGRTFTGEIQAYHNFLRREDPDVIVFHGWDTWPAETATPLVCGLRAKSIMVSHGHSCHMLDIAKLPRGIIRWLRWMPHVLTLPHRIRSYDRVVFLSHKTDWGRFFDARLARLTAACNTTVIPNGVPELPPSLPGRFRTMHGIGSGPMFLCIANYSLRKNQERALRAFSASLLPDATLVFIGSDLGDYGKKMINLWSELQSEGALGHVLFLEGLSREETITALHDCDVKILAAEAETQPIVLLEAMAASKPFISTRTGCVEEFKGGITVRNADEIAAAMQRLASSRDERFLLGKMGRKDYETKYSLKHTSKAWLDLLDSLTMGYGRGN